MYDWLQKHGNFNQDYLETMFWCEGYFDHFNFSAVAENDIPQLVAHRRKGVSESGDKFVYEFIMLPNSGFLNNNQVLAPGCELKITFDRIEADCSVCKVGNQDPLPGKVIEVKNVSAQTTYISSPYLRNLFDQIDEHPIKYKYDDCSVIVRNLPVNEQTIRLDNLYGGLFKLTLLNRFSKICRKYT